MCIAILAIDDLVAYSVYEREFSPPPHARVLGLYQFVSKTRFFGLLTDLTDLVNQPDEFMAKLEEKTARHEFAGYNAAKY